MKKYMVGAAALMIILSLSGCTPPTRQTMANVKTDKVVQETIQTSASDECEQLEAAKKILEDTKASMLKKYDSSYFETKEWKAFVEGYWDGFWKAHKYCKECRLKGLVPKKYLEEVTTSASQKSKDSH